MEEKEREGGGGEREKAMSEILLKWNLLHGTLCPILLKGTVKIFRSLFALL
jgi:hypothetical protein